MKILLGLILSLMIIGQSWATTLTAGYVPVTKTGGSTPALQNGSIYDTGTSGGPGNVGIGSTSPNGTLDVGPTGTIVLGGVRESSWPSGGSQTSGTNMIFGNGSGGFTNVTSSSASGANIALGGTLTTTGNVGINSVAPGNNLDVQGSVRAIGYTGQGGHGIMGIWESASYGTVYLAATDLFFTGYTGVVGGGPAISCITDSNSMPSTSRNLVNVSSTSQAASCASVARKGDYWEITTGSTATVYYISIGA